MDPQKRADVQSVQLFVELQQNKGGTNNKIKKHLESLSPDDPERILDQFLIDWQPIKRFPKLAIINFALFMIFGTFGIVQMVYTLMIKEEQFEYKSQCKSLGYKLGSECIIQDFTISKDMEGPVYMYYQMNNFFQASSEFSKSKSIDQLKGGDINISKARSDCGEKYFTNQQMGKTRSITGQTLNPYDVAIPCGLYAYTYFDDAYKIDGVNIDDSDIAWAIDIDNNYVMKQELKDKAWIDLSNQHFMVWMRPSPASTFRKFYGKIHDGLKAGKYTLRIQNNYDSDQYKSTINLVLTTLNEFGQKNFLGSVILICLSVIFLVVGIVCIIKYIQAKKNM